MGAPSGAMAYLYNQAVISMKKISQLTFSDFEDHPIWTWAEDDDEDVVCSIVGEIHKEEHDALFIKSDFIFNDGTTISGFIAVRMQDQHVYLVALATSWGRLLDIPINPALRPLIKMKELEDAFNKNRTEIFPIHYSTEYLPSFETRYEGSIIEYT
jgi:hypothetical protein